MATEVVTLLPDINMEYSTNSIGINMEGKDDKEKIQVVHLTKNILVPKELN